MSHLNFFLYPVGCEAATNCNGHGTCRADGTCKCDSHFFSADCSSKLFLHYPTIIIFFRYFGKYIVAPTMLSLNS